MVLRAGHRERDRFRRLEQFGHLLPPFIPFSAAPAIASATSARISTTHAAPTTSAGIWSPLARVVAIVGIELPGAQNRCARRRLLGLGCGSGTRLRPRCGEWPRGRLSVYRAGNHKDESSENSPGWQHGFESKTPRTTLYYIPRRGEKSSHNLSSAGVAGSVFPKWQYAVRVAPDGSVHQCPFPGLHPMPNYEPDSTAACLEERSVMPLALLSNSWTSKRLKRPMANRGSATMPRRSES